ncbi:ARM repeat-containing protein [Ascobolus immersus RN42]|uniref:ARM repeat-containing protein n=1 Tax=Ascobolus immersus RN42 TaxID=1160509 RepID=A0A3N4HUU2_ASCIM|nr:ARM repeat-containing protein [Ascobolus immersus RN42]
MDNALPLTPPLLLQVLEAGSSSDPSLLHSAAAQFKKWEIQAGYHALLQDAFLDTSLPTEIRWLAVIQLKNGVDKYWRKMANNGIKKDEKERIRSRLLESIDEQNHLLAAQHALTVSKIARLDFPHDWPDLFPTLLTIITTASSSGPSHNLRLNRTLNLLFHVVKEQASGRLARTRVNLQNVTPEIFGVVARLYGECVEGWTGILGSGFSSGSVEQAVEVLGVSLLCLKTLRRLALSGYEFPNRVEEVRQMWTAFRQQVTSFLTLSSSTTLPPQVQKLLRRHILQLGKLFIDFSNLHATAFALLPDTLEILRLYWEAIEAYGAELGQTAIQKGEQMLRGETAEEESEEEVERWAFMDRVALQGMLLLRGSARMIHNPVGTIKYRHQQEKEETQLAVNVFKTQLFTPEMVRRCMEVLVTRYFVLKGSDLEAWSEDPEGFTVGWEDATESWEFLIRPCAEKLFMDLVNWYKDILTEPLVNVFSNFASVEVTDILTKDAVYTAVGLAAAALHDSINFDQFLESTLIPEVQIEKPGYNILRRRIAILIAQWVTVRISVPARPMVYRITTHLLTITPLNDLVVRLTTARALKASVDEWEFRMEGFEEFTEPILTALMALIEELEGTEAKMSVLDVVGVIAERLGRGVARWSEGIVGLLGPLWEGTGEEHLFKQAILGMLAKLVMAVGEEGVRWMGMVVPMLRLSVDPNEGMQVFLLDEALELWDATIKVTPAPAPQPFLDLLPYLIPCLDLGTLSLKRVLDVLEGYVILAPRFVLDTYGLTIASHFSSLLREGNLKPEANSILTTIVEVMIRVAHVVGGEDGLHGVVGMLLESGFLGYVLGAIRESWEAHQTTGPNKKYSRTDTLIMTHFFELLARITLCSPGVFLRVVGYVAQQRGEPVETTLGWVLEEWFGHFGNVGHPKARKLNCLALTRLLEVAGEVGGENGGGERGKWILGRMQDLLSVWTDVIVELRDEENGTESLIYWAPEDDDDFPSTAEQKRRKELTMEDPVHKVRVQEFVKERLLAAQEACGGAEQFSRDWLEGVDGDVLGEFAKLGVV